MIYRKKRNNHTLLRITAIFTALLVPVAVCFFKMQPVIIRYAKTKAKTIMLNSANHAVVDILSNNNISYDDIVSLSKNEQGSITGIETNIISLNTLKSRISGRLSELISQKKFYDLTIPIGTFLCNEYTNGIGPRINFKMQLSATTIVDFSHEFKSAGINQVLHIIIINIKTTGHLVTAGHLDTITTETSAIAAETVIVGTTPSAFTEVIENENDKLAGLINDYGAEK